jgi:hypothetical protein
VKRSWAVATAVLCGLAALGAPSAGAGDVELVPGTAVLLTQSGGGGGNGGNGTSTSSSTHIFTPAAYADYKRFGGEPTATVDKYPFAPGQFDCPATSFSPCPPKDITYDSAPQGFVFPHYSQFYKSDDLAASFRKPRQFPIHGIPVATGGGGGDSYQVVGHVTHKVYYVDLPLHCVTINVSADLGDTFTPDKLGCGLSPGLDDRQWVEEDETFPATAAQGGNVYVTFINFVDALFPTLSLARSTHGAAFGSFVTDSPCNTLTSFSNVVGPAPDAQPTACPDPRDPYLWTAGPPVADKIGTATRPIPTHNVYIPFIRRISRPIGTGLFGIDAWLLYVAKSTDGGDSWTRHRVAVLAGTENPANIFPQLTIDRGGNLYFTWSETQGGIAESTAQQPGNQERRIPTGEQDVHYKFSTDGGLTWTPQTPPVPEDVIPDPTEAVAPQPPTGLPTTDGINLTKEANDSAIFPWMVAGDPGQVGIVYYKANTGINSNVAFTDAEGTRPNPSVWNVFFGQSQNALNTGANFKSVQVSAQPNHLGQICTGGLSCEGDRDLLDFIAFDIDSRGAAVIAYSDDNQRRNTDTRDRVTRQISGPSLFKNTNVTLQSDWPIRDHAVFDRAGDVFDTASVANGPCPGMDVLKTTADRKDDRITITMTLNGPPTAANAIACGRIPGTSSGGIWGAEFWAASGGDTGPANNFYIAYRDDLANGQRVEGGTVDNLNIGTTSLEFFRRTGGTLRTDCFTTPPPQTCTIAMTVIASNLGITPGNGLYSITGLSAYFLGEDGRIPATRVILGNSEQADATAALHYLGSGTP